MLKQTLQELGVSTSDKRLFGVLLAPSWASGLLCTALSLGTIVSVLVSTHFGNTLQQEVDTLRALNADSDLSYYGGSSGFTFDSVLSNIVTFVFWALLGIAVYFTIVGIVNTIRETKEFKTELNYVNHPRSAFIKATVFRLVLRAAVLGLWFLYLRLFFATVVPSCLLWAYAAAHSFTFSSVCSITLAFVVMLATLHVHVILLRLLALRPRLFHSELYS